MAKATSETVNLDALVPREDFDIEEAGATAAKLGNEIYVQTLTPTDRLATTRKPDFQRETSSWSPEIVADFIESIANADVVPALIMWRSPNSGKTFIIDGAHRLSAVAAWVNDDYGDGVISKDFYGDYIPDAQIAAAKKTRSLIEDRIGKFSDLVEYVRGTKISPTPQKSRLGNNILSAPLNVQPIQGDAQAAEKSYKRINSTAVAISKQELTLIDSRTHPVGIATRALMRAGTGYEYWSKFKEPTRSDIKGVAASVYEQLIRPITEYPLVALDLPSPKRGYGANSLNTILDLVTILNAGNNRTKKADNLDDSDGTATLRLLEHIRKLTERVFGNVHSGSLALHPALYCYDIKGKFVGKAFIGAIEFVRDLEIRNKFFEFTEARKSFEDFLIRYPYIMTQIGTSQGSGGRRGVSAVTALYSALFEGLRSEKKVADIIAEMQKNRAIDFLNWETPQETDSGRKFSDADKATATIRAALEKDICPECGGRMYIKDRSYDHVDRKQDGGKSVASNIALIHPYCNTGYKEARLHKQRKGVANAPENS